MNTRSKKMMVMSVLAAGLLNLGDVVDAEKRLFI